MATFSEAITNVMIAGMDPEAGMKRDYMRSVVEANEANVIKVQAETVVMLGKLIAEAQEQKQDESVIDAYRKLLKRAQGSS